ncbi:hypothetical protein EJ08DRAFT_649944 [Tothia fuscella]|uniref:Uncharacterized protein n=1 Tax=Tothia fuscella TaxID=1048955 RepID=A0A9P4NRU4_9PEZI|nr:hypothetical protein EJ08DRAFT_649944 [Tothia fuscella]
MSTEIISCSHLTALLILSNTTQDQGTDIGRRIEANCARIWGADAQYDLDMETNDNIHYQRFVKKDFGDSFSAPLIATVSCRGEAAALAQLDRELAQLADHVESGQMKPEQKAKLIAKAEKTNEDAWKKVFENFEKRKGLQGQGKIDEKKDSNV